MHSGVLSLQIPVLKIAGMILGRDRLDKTVKRQQIPNIEVRLVESIKWWNYRSSLYEDVVRPQVYMHTCYLSQIDALNRIAPRKPPTDSSGARFVLRHQIASSIYYQVYSNTIRNGISHFH